MIVYVVLFHDVWEVVADPGIENEYGCPENTSIDGIYETRYSAEAAIDLKRATFPQTDHTFYTIEEHPLTP